MARAAVSGVLGETAVLPFLLPLGAVLRSDFKALSTCLVFSRCKVTKNYVIYFGFLDIQVVCTGIFWFYR